MPEITPFAIGCFHFGVKAPPPLKISGSDYLEELNKSLESISNVANIEIWTDDTFGEMALDIDTPVHSINEGYDFFPPQGCRLVVIFEIYIPERIQDDLIPRFLRLNTGAERFRAVIRHPFDFPVTFVEALDAKQDCEPAEAIIVVREFLNKHFIDSKSYIRFESMGPSPFHANFYLRLQPDLDQDRNREGISCRIQNRRGYDTVEFLADASRYKDIAQARDALFDEIESEASLYYKVTHAHLIQMRRWEKIQNLVNDLLEIQRAEGIGGFFRRNFSLSKRTNEAVIALSEFESARIFEEYFQKSDYQSLLSNGKEPFLDKYLKDNNREAQMSYPVSQTKEIIDLIEDRRSKSTEGLITLLAALLGGAIGTIATLLATKP